MASSVEEENHLIIPILAREIPRESEEERYAAAKARRRLSSSAHPAGAVADRNQYGAPLLTMMERGYETSAPRHLNESGGNMSAVRGLCTRSYPWLTWMVTVHQHVRVASKHRS